MLYQNLVFQIVNNNNNTIVKKIWGEEIWIVNQEYCGKLLLINKKKRCSFHYHKEKKESFLLISGAILLEMPHEKTLMEPGMIAHIPVGIKHRFTGIAYKSEIIEFSTHHKDEDSYREVNSGEVPQKEWEEILQRYRHSLPCGNGDI